MQFETPLCEIAYRYGTDKCPQVAHSYTPFYHRLLADKRKSFRKVTELGIGTKAQMGRRAVPHYRTGASLYMWRDYFPNAQIYGADYMGNALFQDERITTLFCDERKASDLEAVIRNTGRNIDLFIDDGSHYGCHQVFACATVLPLLKKDVIYIIEDVNHADRVTRDLTAKGFICKEIRFVGKDRMKGDSIMIVRRP